MLRTMWLRVTLLSQVTAPNIKANSLDREFKFLNNNRMKKKIDINEQELKDLKLVRNYFGKNEQTTHQHFCYGVLNNLFKKLNGDTEKRTSNSDCLKFGNCHYMKSRYPNCTEGCNSYRPKI